ncbi:MAG: multicopper oxidase domain-containing protein [Saprospiraceae bacterium]|nr:multicopper oxidase domain-containing protein [Saprospiraceae bacterium]
MKISALFAALFLFNIASLFAQNNGKSQADGSYFTCPMHPKIHNDAPGSCPICGMDLVKAKPKKAKPKPKPKPALPALPALPAEASAKEGEAPPPVEPAPAHENHAHEPMPKDSAKSPILEKTKPTPTTPEPPKNEIPAAAKIETAPPRTVRYDLFIRDTLVNFTGKPRRAIAVNGQIPMPTLTFTEGDTALIYVHNELKESTSLHWHGLFLPNKEDGVPNLTQMPIEPKSTHVYTFPIIQSGTHWYHSHSGLQEQIGMYGSFIMKKRSGFRPGIDDLPEIPLVLSEWTDMNPIHVHRMLHNATDWFAIKKGTTQSYAEAIRQGYFKTKVANEWKRMNAMDVSDVFYDRFLINGKNVGQLAQFKGGDKIRLRISNGGASTYFWLKWGGGKMTVVANDGNDVEPVEVDRLLIAASETYDVIIAIPFGNGSFEFLATAEDRTKSASLFLGNGIQYFTAPMPKLKYFEGMKMMNGMMKMNGELDDMGMKMSLNQMDMNSVMYPEIAGMAGEGMGEMPMGEAQYDVNALSDIKTLNYALLKSPTPTALPKNAPLKELRFELSGNMNRYVWSLDNRVVSEVDKILIKKGQNVRIVLYNGSMMRHPMHLHGHDFRLLNGQGDFSPLKNIVDIMPMETDTIEFNANVEGDWFFHCHILYHMMSGMGRVFTYENQAANPLITNPKLAKRQLFADDRKFHSMARVGLETNGSDGEAGLMNTRWKLNTLWHLGYHGKHGYESETTVGRYLGKMQWLFPYIGFDYHYKKEGKLQDGFFDLKGSPRNIFGNETMTMFGQTSNKNNRKAAVVGIAYTLPMLFVADARVDSEGRFRFQIGREDIPVAKRLRANIMLNSDKEYMVGGRYILTNYLSLSSHYDSDMGIGVGLTITY